MNTYDTARKMTFADENLRYAAHARCPCGAGLAYVVSGGVENPEKVGPWPFLDDAWDCSDILTGRAPVKGQPGWQTHTDRLPFSFYEIKSEHQPSAGGATTRPT